MTVSEKGQVTIPIEIRRKLGILPDTEVELEVVGNAVLIRKARGGGGRGRELVRRLRGRGTVAMTTDQIMR